MLVRIEGKTQSYDWGKLGKASKVAELAAASSSSFTVSESSPYAELWMGTHPNGPSTALTTDQLVPLKQLVNEKTLGSGIAAKYDNDLPFLFKVLSIRKALSIQAHPDKKLAEELYQKFPNVYKDPNHKPEMAVALTEFEAFVGFRPLEEISKHLTDFPEFATLIGQQITSNFQSQVVAKSSDVDANKKSLQSLFKALMESQEEIVTKHLRALVQRAAQLPQAKNKGSIEELIVRLNEQFPDDIGCFCALLLNYVSLLPGEAIFLAANEPHAYLSGDCVECMAASDNVVRSGLTPKFKDVQTLVNMLTYKYGPADAQILRGDQYKQHKHTLIFDPPIEEFTILKTSLSASQQETVEGIEGPSILIVTQGQGFIESGGTKLEAKQGFIFFVGADAPVTLSTGSSEGFTSYRAYCSL